MVNNPGHDVCLAILLLKVWHGWVNTLKFYMYLAEGRFYAGLWYWWYLPLCKVTLRVLDMLYLPTLCPKFQLTTHICFICMHTCQTKMCDTKYRGGGVIASGRYLPTSDIVKSYSVVNKTLWFIYFVCVFGKKSVLSGGRRFCAD